MQRLEISGAVRPPIGVVRRQRGTEGKAVGRSTARSSPYSGEVKNDWSITSKSPPYFHVLLTFYMHRNF